MTKPLMNRKIRIKLKRIKKRKYLLLKCDTHHINVVRHKGKPYTEYMVKLTPIKIKTCSDGTTITEVPTSLMIEKEKVNIIIFEL